MATIDLTVIEWPDLDGEGPRLVGRLRDADLVEEALRRLEQARLRELSRLQGRARLRPITSDPDALE